MSRRNRPQYRGRTASVIAQYRGGGTIVGFGAAEVDIESPGAALTGQGVTPKAGLEAGLFGDAVAATRAKTLTGMPASMPCACAAAPDLTEVRWVRKGERGAVLLVTCRMCFGTATLDRREEATLCSHCDRLLDVGDAKCCIGGHGVFCQACARRAFPIPGPDWV